MLDKSQLKFNVAITAKLRARYATKVCLSMYCADCGSAYVPDSDTSAGLCHFCVPALAVR